MRFCFYQQLYFERKGPRVCFFSNWIWTKPPSLRFWNNTTAFGQFPILQTCVILRGTKKLRTLLLNTWGINTRKRYKHWLLPNRVSLIIFLIKFTLFGRIFVLGSAVLLIVTRILELPTHFRSCEKTSIRRLHLRLLFPKTHSLLF